MFVALSMINFSIVTPECAPSRISQSHFVMQPQVSASSLDEAGVSQTKEEGGCGRTAFTTTKGNHCGERAAEVEASHHSCSRAFIIDASLSPVSCSGTPSWEPLHALQFHTCSRSNHSFHVGRPSPAAFHSWVRVRWPSLQSCLFERQRCKQ